ncbi:M1 family aminopeptidase [Bacteroidota bacterium]
MKNTLLILLSFLALNIFGQTTNPDQFKSLRETHYKGDINIYYNPVLDKYDVYFVKLDIAVSDQSTDVQGNVTIHAKAKKELDTLLFDLDSSMTVDSIFINSKKVIAEHIGNELRYIFDSPLLVNEIVTAQIYYQGTPPLYGGVSNGYDSQWGKNVTWTLSESFHASEWWPCKQVLSDKIDSAYIFLTCDDDCMAGSNGLLTNIVSLPNNKKRFEWKTYYPINYYLISFAVAEYQDYSTYAYPLDADPILIQNFVYNSFNYLSQNQADIDNTIDFIELYSDKFGLYPFANEKYGHCLTTLGGGMEHQTMTTLGNFGYTLVAHELGHMWFGDYVTCATWQDIWINEGFASYSEYVALENLASDTDARNWIDYAHERALMEAQGSVYIPFEDAASESRIFSYNLSYKKGASILHVLRHEINNDDLFFSSLENYLSEYGDSVATGEDFKNSIEATTGMDFDAFFDQWYYGKGYPRFNIGYTQMNDTLFMTVSQSTSSYTTSLFQVHVDYKVYYNGGDTTLRLFQSQNVETFKIPINEPVIDIVVDPDKWILKQQGTVDSVESPGNNQSLFSLYPNPATETINVDFNLKLFDLEKQILIFDLNGRLIKSISSNDSSVPIDVSALSKGFYFIKGISDNKSYTYKFIKQ